MAKKKIKKVKKPPSKTTKANTERAGRPRQLVDVASAALKRMFDAASAAEEILFLKEQVKVLKGERQRLRKRSAEQESQREAVFATLKRRVTDAQAEIQASTLYSINVADTEKDQNTAVKTLQWSCWPLLYVQRLPLTVFCLQRPVFCAARKPHCRLLHSARMQMVYRARCFNRRMIHIVLCAGTGE